MATVREPSNVEQLKRYIGLHGMGGQMDSLTRAQLALAISVPPEIQKLFSETETMHVMKTVARAERIQLSRKRDWRMPANTVSVARPGKLGNPFTIVDAIESGYATTATAQAFVVECFRDWLGPTQSGRDWWQGPKSDVRKAQIFECLPALRGKNLACWCKLDQPCHASVLLKLANADAPSP